MPGIQEFDTLEEAQAALQPTKKASTSPYGRGVVEGLFPGVQVTDSVRARNSALGQKNPKSWHVNSDKAVDIRRIPGMTFDDYIKKINDAGYDVIEAKDEYTDPSPWATGPHWHAVIGNKHDKAPEFDTLEEAQAALKGAPTAPMATQGFDTLEEAQAALHQMNKAAIPDPATLGSGSVAGSEQTAITGAEKAQNDDIQNILVSGAKSRPWEDISKEIKEKYPNQPQGPELKWYYDHYKDGGKSAINWVADKARLGENDDQNTITVTGNKENLDPNMALGRFLGNNAALAYHQGLMGAKERQDIRNQFANNPEILAALAEQERMDREELSAAIERDSTGMPVLDTILALPANIVGGIDPTYALSGGVGKTALARMISAPLIQGATDVALQKVDEAQGITDHIDPERLLTAAATGAAFQGLGEAGHALLKKYGNRGVEVHDTGNSNVLYVPEPTNGKPLSKAATKANSVAQVAADVTKDWADRPEIRVNTGKDKGSEAPFQLVVHQSKAAFNKAEPELAAKIKADGAENKALGFYDEDGNIHILAHNVKDPAEVPSLVFHEALGHYGLSKNFGDDLDSVLNDLYERNPALKREADRLGKGEYSGVYEGEDKNARLVEEALAKRSEKGRVSSNILDKFRAAIAPYMRKMKLRSTLSDAEVKAILADAHSSVINEGNRAVSPTGVRYALTTHVSPHDFTNVDENNPYGAFDHSKMGSGEGAQVYGWGTYLGENTRDAYYRKFSKPDKFIDSTIHGREPLEWLRENAPTFFEERHVDAYYKNLQQNPTKEAWEGYVDYLKERQANLEEEVIQDRLYNDYVKNLLREAIEEKAFAEKMIEGLPSSEKKPKTYEVDVPDEQQARMLLWDKPLDEQPLEVQKAAKDQNFEVFSKEELDSLYDEEQKASEAWTDYYEKNIRPRDAARDEFETAAFKKYREKGLSNVEAWEEAELDGKDWAQSNPLPKGVRQEYIRLGKVYDDIQEKLRNSKLNLTGETFYKELANKLGSPQKASEYLASKGIPGNKYEDGFSRGKYGDKSYNYVMYNDKGPDAPKIINKYMLKKEEELPQSPSGVRYALTTHVSPHDFTNVDEDNPHGAFDHSKMGSGEGAQVYGWGTYLGENTKDAYYSKFSRQLESNTKISINGKPIEDFAKDIFPEHSIGNTMAAQRVFKTALNDVARELYHYKRNWPEEEQKNIPDKLLKVADQLREDQKEYTLEYNNKYKELQDALQAKESVYADALNDLQHKMGILKDSADRAYYKEKLYREIADSNPTIEKFADKPKTYEVDVPDEQQARMLLWDKPLDEQPENVKKAARDAGLESTSREDIANLEDRRFEFEDKARDFWEKNLQPHYDRLGKIHDAAYDKAMDELTKMSDAEARKALRISEETLSTLTRGSTEDIEAEMEAYAFRRAGEAVKEYRKASATFNKNLREYRKISRELDTVLEKIDNARYLTGETLYKELSNKLGSPQKASEYLASKGIPGNKYEDGFSRGKYGDKSYNYVMYNDKGPDAPKIINKYMLKKEDELPQKTVGKFMKAMKGAELLHGKYREDVVADRKEKMSKLAAARTSSSGEKGLYAELSALKGKTTKPVIEPFREKFTKKEAKALFDAIKNHPDLQWMESMKARQALLKLFEGEVPTRGELDLLAKVFPKDFIKYALKLRTRGMKLRDAFVEGTSLPRALMASVDLSAPFRQGVFLVGRKEFWKGLAPMFKHAFSPEFHEEVMREIKTRPTYGLMEDSGLAITKDAGSDYAMNEEAFMSRLAEKIPGIGALVRGSERAYVGFLNKLRADVFDDLVSRGAELGRNDLSKGVFFDRDTAAAKSLANYINHATGRGSLGKTFDKAAPWLSAAFFSPRLIASRVNLLNPFFYGAMHPFVRREAVKDLLAFGAITTTVMTLASLAGADVETDMRSSDFLKIRDGKTRYDILGGFGQYLTLAARLSPEFIGGNHTKTLVGEVKKLGPNNRAGTRLDILNKFLENKLAPVPSYIADYWRGKDAVGNTFTEGSSIVKRMIPLFLQDLYQGYQNDGAAGVVKVLPSGLGVGVASYDQVPSRYTAFGMDTEKKAPKSDSTIEEIDRLSTVNGKDTDLVAPATKANLPKGPIRDAAKKEDIEEFQKLSGTYIYEDLKSEMSSAGWKAMNDKDRIDLVKIIVRDQRKNAREDLFGDKGDTKE